MHNYYKYATHVNIDFAEIAFLVSKNLYNSTKNIRGSTGDKSKCYREYYGDYKPSIIYIAKVALFPIAGIKTKNVMNFSQDMCNYTVKGREKIHDKLKGINYDILMYIMRNPILNDTTEYNDNRISLYVGQKGKCSITGESLQIGNMESHHKKTRKDGGTDEYSNLTFVIKDVHKLIHAIKEETISYYLSNVKKFINLENLSKLNKLRKSVGNCELYIN